jgi:hypothetical protein
MVLTRQLLEKEPPAGISTRQSKPLSLREQQALLHAWRADCAERAKQWRNQASMQTSPRVGGDAQPSMPPLHMQPSPPSLDGGLLSPLPKCCSPRLQSRSGPNDNGSAIAVAAIYYGEESSLDVSDVELATVGGVYCSDDDDYDDNSANGAGVRKDIVTRGKITGEMEDDQPEEEKNDDNEQMTITRLDVKSKSKMSDADLRNYFSSNYRRRVQAVEIEIAIASLS